MPNYTTDDNGIPLKRCTSGDACVHPMGCLLPATPEYFTRHKKSFDGLDQKCKACKAAQQKVYYAANKERLNARGREYYYENLDTMRAKGREYYIKHAEQYRERSRQWRKDNPEKVRQQSRDWIKKNPEKFKARLRKYRQINRITIRANAERWRQRNPHKLRINTEKRLARKRQLPDTFTVEQWFQCLEYFNHCCPVCGNQLRDLFGHVVPHADHWIALSNPECPGTVAENMICLCSDCNWDKSAKDAKEWLVGKYGTRRANEILARVQAYFQWVQLQD